MNYERLDSLEKLNQVYQDWLRLQRTGLHEHGNQRFGQYIWNRFTWDRQSWPELFYERDTYMSYRLVLQYLQSKEKQA